VYTGDVSQGWIEMSESSSVSTLIACHECDLLHRKTALPPGGVARCTRCGAELYANPVDSLNRALALTLAAAILFFLVNLFPIVDLDAQGIITKATLPGSALALHEAGMTSVAVLVFATTVLVPTALFAAMLYLLVHDKFGKRPPMMPLVLRAVHELKHWGMVEVYLLGVLAALVKLGHLAIIKPGPSLWVLAVLVFVLAAAVSAFDAHDFWHTGEAGARESSL
jgi:paraquat-inducible protein A